MDDLGLFFLLQIRTTVDHGTHPHHVDRAGACCSLAVLLGVAHRLVVVGLVVGVQRRVDQVDHQHRIHLTEELADLDQQNTQTQRNAEPRATAPLAKPRKMRPFFRLFGPPLRRGAAQLEQNHNCECTLSSRESWRRRGSLLSLSSAAFQRSSFSYHVIYTRTEAATTEHMTQHVYG